MKHELNGNLDFPIPVLGLCARSGTGKTTLLTVLLPFLLKRGLNVGVLKHTHHDFEIDRENKDSYRIRKSGAREVIVASKFRWALIHENEDQRTEPKLMEMVKRMDLQNLDLVLLEGFKQEYVPKIEIHRFEIDKELIHSKDPGIIAVASDGGSIENLDIPLLDLNAPESIVDFIEEWIKKINKEGY